MDNVFYIISLTVILFIGGIACVIFLKKKKDLTNFIFETKISNEYYDNGELRRTYTIKVKKSKTDNSIISEKIDGEERFFYPSGIVNRINIWDNGKLQGPFTVYYEDGNTYIRGNYENNEFKGLYEVMDKANNVIWSKKY